MVRTGLISLLSNRNGRIAGAVMAAFYLATPAMAQDSADLVSACSDAARQFFENFDAPSDMRADEPRVDGSRTSGGHRPWQLL